MELLVVSILLFIVAIAVPASVWYLFIRKTPQEYNPCLDRPSLTGADIIHSRNKMEEASNRGREAFLLGLSIDDCPYQDQGEDECYGQRWNLYYHWRKGFNNAKEYG